MDRTSEYRQTLERARLSRGPGVGSTGIMAPVVSRQPFTKAALQVLRSLDEMRQHLSSQRSQYLTFSHSLKPGTGMTDRQRDDLELMVIKSAQLSAADIDALKQMVDAEGDDAARHQQGVVLFLYDMVNEMTRMINSMKQIRTAHTRRFAQSSRPPPSIGAPAPRSTLTVDEFQRTLEQDNAARAQYAGEEERVLAQENAEFLDEMQDELDQVRQAERGMVEIARLLELFSTKVMEQAEVVNIIEGQVIDSVNHIKMGDKYLEKAEKHGVRFRIWILFMLLVAGLSLLFLDHIYD